MSGKDALFWYRSFIGISLRDSQLITDPVRRDAISIPAFVDFIDWGLGARDMKCKQVAATDTVTDTIFVAF